MGLAAFVLLTSLWISQMIVAPPRVRLSQSARPHLGVTVRDADGGGASVIAVVSPAREAGLRTGDTIVRIRDRQIGGAQDVGLALADRLAGDWVQVEARRGDGGQAIRVLADVEMGSRPPAPDEVGLDHDDIHFENGNGLVLRGWLIPAAGSGPRPAVIFGHGNAADRRHFLELAPDFHRAGFTLLLFDFSGRGESDGEVITLGAAESRDLAAAFEWLAARDDVDGGRIAFVGRSMGGAAALIAAGDGTPVRAVVADSSFAELEGLVYGLVGRFRLPPPVFARLGLGLAGWRASFDPASVRPVDAIASIDAPVLLIHGSEDEIVPFADARRLADAGGERLTLRVIEGARHNDPRSPEVVTGMIEFLERSLAR